MKTTFSGWRYLWKSEDIRRKLLFTFLILAIYRLAANVPAPGVDFEILPFAFVTVIVGGCGSLRGEIVGSMIKTVQEVYLGIG